MRCILWAAVLSMTILTSCGDKQDPVHEDAGADGGADASKDRGDNSNAVAASISYDSRSDKP